MIERLSEMMCAKQKAKKQSKGRPEGGTITFTDVLTPLLTFRKKTYFYHFALTQCQAYAPLVAIICCLVGILHLVMLRPGEKEQMSGAQKRGSHVSFGVAYQVYIASIIVLFLYAVVITASLASGWLYWLVNSPRWRISVANTFQCILLTGSAVYTGTPLFDVASQVIEGNEADTEISDDPRDATAIFTRSHSQLSAALMATPLFLGFVSASGIQMFVLFFAEVIVLVALALIERNDHSTYELLVLDILRCVVALLLACVIFASNVNKTFTIASLEAQHATKSAFLQQVAHDLKAPVQALANSTELLDDDQSVEDMKETLNIATTYIRSTLDAALALGRNRNGRERMLNLVHCSPKVLVHNMAKVIETCFNRNTHVPIHIQVKDNVPENVVTDQNIAESCLHNLLSNARKYTSSGSISVTVEADKISEEHSRQLLSARPELAGADICPLTHSVHFHVRDTGVGIPPERRHNVFMMPYHRDYEAQAAGTGLGLWSAYQQAQTVLGTMTYASNEPEPGSTFTLTLATRAVPAASEDETSQELTHASQINRQSGLTQAQRLDSGDSSGQSGTPRSITEHSNCSSNQLNDTTLTILVADDTPLVLHTLARSMQRFGSIVLTARSGQEAFNTWKSYNGRIHCIFSDVNMNDGNGPELVSWIRSEESNRLIQPTIISLMTGGTFSDTEQKGVDFVVAKPVKLSKLNTILKYVVRHEKEETS